MQVLTSDYASQILSLTSRAVSSIDIVSYVVKFVMEKKADRVFVFFEALRAFRSRGGSVRVILDFPRVHKSNYHCNMFSTRRFLEAGFEVAYLHSGQTQHSKLIIFDGLHAVVGSHNLTAQSVINRFDISLLIDDRSLLLFFKKYFNNLWERSVLV